MEQKLGKNLSKMDHNEITMDMDVKMDLKEKKLEYFQLRVSTVIGYGKMCPNQMRIIIFRKNDLRLES